MYYLKFKEINQFGSPGKLASQSMPNKLHVIEIPKTCTVAFIKPISHGCLIYREEKTEDGEKVFFKALTNRFWLTSKSCSWFNKVFHGRPSTKWASWIGNDMSLKVDKMKKLLRKSPWKWSLVNRWKKRVMIKIINGFYI